MGQKLRNLKGGDRQGTMMVSRKKWNGGRKKNGSWFDGGRYPHIGHGGT